MALRELLVLPHFWLIVSSTILTLSGILILLLKKKSNTQFFLHAVFLSLSIVLNFLGIIFTKNFNLRDLHAILGMNSANLFVTAAFGGILAKMNIQRKETVKKIHVWWGITVFLYSIGVSIYGIVLMT